MAEEENVTHKNVECDLCKQYPIIGDRYKCVICKDFDLCSQCEPQHDHPLIKYKHNAMHYTNESFNGQQQLIIDNINRITDCNKQLIEETNFLKKQLIFKHNEITILNDKINLLNNMCSSYTLKYKDAISQNDLLVLDQQYSQLSLSEDVASYKQINELNKQLQREHRYSISKNDEIKTLKNKLHQYIECKKQKQSLETEITNLHNIAEQDINTQKLEIEKLTHEIMSIKEQNNVLQKEKEALAIEFAKEKYHRLKRDKNTLKPPVIRRYSDSFSKTKHFSNIPYTFSPTKPTILAQDIECDTDTDTFMDMKRKSQSPFPIGMDINASLSSQMTTITIFDDMKDDLSDTTDGFTKKEYLHLTATVINIKYPQIEHISPVDLINRVEHCNFWEYYDKMQKIMENEINKMNGTQKSIEIASKKQIYFEKQSLEMSILHSLNTLFQKKKYTAQHLDKICEELAPNKYLNPHKTLFVGNYDVNVLMVILQSACIDVQWFDSRKANSKLNILNEDWLCEKETYSKFMGFILNIPLRSFGFIKRRHWITIKKINDIWYKLDSREKEPIPYVNDNQVIKLQSWLIHTCKNNDGQLLICRIKR